MNEPTARGRPSAHQPELHPDAHAEWFRALPHARRAQMNREWRAGLAREHELVRSETRATLESALRMGVLYAVCNGFCPGDAGVTYLGAFVVGGMLGILLERLRAARLLSALLGLAVFFVFQWLSRGGLSPLHLFVLLPVGAISAHLGMKRELA